MLAYLITVFISSLQYAKLTSTLFGSIEFNQIKKNDAIVFLSSLE